ncbi:glutathione S-transferase [Vibrio sp. D404a]|uniref:glutathione S-transferase N-terminal domain-containing protein n=1 Tax=unclassified Vibrio TaxID=2614977 RepID=UPI002556CEFF|nr:MULTISPECIES: glutathione S-transferase family protein [unclassified Vibrio]MDK9735961.1 glutathione S-transferase [Vibrio sp. D404a]MDK9797873.1 glutathione S-transferase [Vibrio sp. D449a]
MKLYLNDTSPFSRAVVATALLTKSSSLSLEWVDPWASPAELIDANPFCLIPTLVTKEGITLSESLCICQHLIEVSQPEDLIPIDYLNVDQVSQLGFAKTLMEIAFRSAALKRYTDESNELIARGEKGVTLALKRLNQQLNPPGIDSYLQPNLANLYLHVALDYVQFRHSAIFNEVENNNIADFMQRSPFSEVLDVITLETLSTQPSFGSLVNP